MSKKVLIIDSAILKGQLIHETLLRLRGKDTKVLLAEDLNPETRRLLKKVVEQQHAFKKSTPEEQDAWIERLTEDFVNAGEAEYGEDYGTPILDEIVPVDTED